MYKVDGKGNQHRKMVQTRPVFSCRTSEKLWPTATGVLSSCLPHSSLCLSFTTGCFQIIRPNAQ